MHQKTIRLVLTAQFAKFSIRDSFEKNSRQVFKKSLGKREKSFSTKILVKFGKMN